MKTVHTEYIDLHCLEKLVQNCRKCLQAMFFLHQTISSTLPCPSLLLSIFFSMIFSFLLVLGFSLFASSQFSSSIPLPFFLLPSPFAFFVAFALSLISLLCAFFLRYHLLFPSIYKYLAISFPRISLYFFLKRQKKN